MRNSGYRSRKYLSQNCDLVTNLKKLIGYEFDLRQILDLMIPENPEPRFWYLEPTESSFQQKQFNAMV